eukprot:TRINITY_DN252_c0_g1_i7.p2 TRINITY_DN252_c0_g1~~TRINITY_DN252_c0_g1_i7.p2  ORF type:complete len:143 (-),score=36.00 TRINITY_DN252_c0_g1_i7:135-563(-)
MIRRPPRSTHCISSAASDVYKRQVSTQSTWAFERTKESFQGESPYRICQDSIQLLQPFMTKRKIQCSLEDIKIILSKKNVKYEELKSEELQKQLKTLGFGTICICFEQNKQIEAIVCHNFHQSIAHMCSREYVNSFKFRYYQ